MDIFFINHKNFTRQEIKFIIDNFGKNHALAKRRREYAFGRLLVKMVCLNFYNRTDAEIEIDNQKPYFVNNKDLHFSISHSRNLVIAAFDNKSTGADVEFMRPRNFERIFNYYKLTPEKIDKETFYAFWTAYEAGLKLQDTKKSAVTFKLLPDYMVSLASSKSFDIKARLKIYELSSPNASTNPSELINWKLVNDNSENENTVVIQEMNTASLEFFEPLYLKTE